MPTKKSKGILFEPAYRNTSEKRLGKQLEGAQVPFGFETLKLPYEVPARTSTYLADFIIDNKLIIEMKGWFGKQGAKERQKFVLLKDQYPDYDIRFVFTDAKKKIYKGSPTTYAMWADEHGFKWATGGVIPDTWLQEMKQWTKSKSTKSSKKLSPSKKRPQL